MRAIHRPLSLRALLAAVSGLVVVSLFVPWAAASAEEGAPGGDVLVGELVQAWPEYQDPADAAEHGAEGPLSWIETEPGQAVRVPTEDVEDIPLGATVEVTLGETVADEASDEGGLEPAREVLEAEVLGAAPEAPAAPEPAPATPLVTNDVTIVRVVPQGGAQDATTITQLVDAVNGPVHDFWAEQSDGAIQIGATGWADWVPTTAGCSSPYAIWNEVAIEVGFQADDGKHLMVYVPNNQPNLAACAYGLGGLGAGVTSGGLFYVRGLLTSVIAHELGHNFGLGHSSGRQCAGVVEAGSCRTVAYRDYYDVMGVSWNQVGSLNPPQADLLDLIPADQQQTIEANGVGGVVPLTPYGSRAGIRALRLIDADGVRYWLEYRAATGRDQWLGSPATNPFPLQSGVLLRRSNDGHDTSLLLDGTPSATTAWNSDLAVALTPGRVVQVSGGDLTVTVVSQDSSGATVRVVAAGRAPFPRDWNADDRADLLVADPAGGLTLFPSAAGGGFQTRKLIGNGWQIRDRIIMAGDWDGDLRRDVIARDPVNGDLWLYPGNGTGAWQGAGRLIGRGWNTMDSIVSAGDWDGDGHPDVLARRRADGVLFMYRGNGAGGWLGGTDIGYGWQVMTALTVTGDWDGDGLADLIGRDRGGLLWVYPGDGRGGFGTSRVIGQGWEIIVQLVGPGDWDGDGAPDLLGQKADGSLWLYRGNGHGGFLGQRQIGSGWNGHRIAV